MKQFYLFFFYFLTVQSSLFKVCIGRDPGFNPFYPFYPGFNPFNHRFNPGSMHWKEEG